MPGEIEPQDEPDQLDLRSTRPPYALSIAGTLLAAREAVMAPLRVGLRKAHFTEAQWRVLRVLDEEGESDGRTLASAALLHPPSVTRIVQELSQRGLIDRRLDEQDGRRHRFVITEKGRNIVAASAAFSGMLVARYRTGFGADRLDALLSELRAFTRLVISERLDTEAGDEDGFAP